MNLIEQWIEDARSVITEPVEFFEGEKRRDGFGYPLKFAAVSIVISSLLTSLGSLIYGPLVPGSNVVVGVISTMIGSLVGGVIFLLLWSGLVHVMVYLLGGKKGYRATLAVFAYALALAPLSALAGLVPILGGIVAFALALYAIYIQIRGLEEFQGMETAQAAIAVVLPLVVLAVLATIIFILILSLFVVTSSTAGVVPQV